MWKSLHWLFWLVNSPLLLTTSWELDASTKEIRGPHLHNGQVCLQMLMSVCVYQCVCVWEWAFYSHRSSHCVGSRLLLGFHGKDFGMDPSFSCRVLRPIGLAVTPLLLHPCSPEAQSWGWLAFRSVDIMKCSVRLHFLSYCLDLHSGVAACARGCMFIKYSSIHF